MATTRFIQNVQSGNREYFASIDVAAQDDTIEFEMNGELIADDILIVGGGSNSYQLQITYPSSQITVTIVNTGTVSSWFLNDPISLNRGKNWYRLPSKSVVSLIVTNASPTAEELSLSVIGRGA